MAEYETVFHSEHGTLIRRISDGLTVPAYSQAAQIIINGSTPTLVEMVTTPTPTPPVTP